MHRAWLRWAPALTVSVLGCGTDAVGIDACREVEFARCEAAVDCGLIDDAEQCKRFYRDHCLHGVKLEEAPSSVAVDDCVETIQRAGRCARQEGPKTAPDACGRDELAESNARQVCDIVQEPQRAPDCAFLDVELEPEPEPEPDAGPTDAD